MFWQTYTVKKNYPLCSSLYNVDHENKTFYSVSHDEHVNCEHLQLEFQRSMVGTRPRLQRTRSTTETYTNRFAFNMKQFSADLLSLSDF